MEKECSIISLVYIERLLEHAKIRIDEKNWKRLVFITLIVGSKVWDDESYENVHFAKVFTRFTLKEIVELERMFLELVNFNVGIKSSEYAKYYFILRTYSEQEKRSFPLQPLDVDTVRQLQSNAKRVESSLRTEHEGIPINTF
jgi:hypothetical protein